jgi:hypothetical protein
MPSPLVATDRALPDKHDETLRQGMTFDELVASLRQIDGQRDKGKHPPNFRFRSKPFPHFHNGPDRTYAGVRFGGDLEPVTASTPKQREVLAHRLEPDPETAHVVSWMFAQRLGGRSAARIARALNDAGMPVPVRRRPPRYRPCSRVWTAIAVRTRMLVRVTSRFDDNPSTVIACSSCSEW